MASCKIKVCDECRKILECPECRIDVFNNNHLMYIYGNHRFACFGPMRVIADFASEKGVSKEVVDKLKNDYQICDRLDRPFMLIDFLLANLPGVTVGELVELLKDDDIYK